MQKLSEKTRMFSDSHIKLQLIKYLKDEVEKCDSVIESSQNVINDDESMPEDLTLAVRKIEVYFFRKRWLDKQINWLQIDYDFVP